MLDRDYELIIKLVRIASNLSGKHRKIIQRCILGLILLKFIDEELNVKNKKAIYE